MNITIEIFVILYIGIKNILEMCNYHINKTHKPHTDYTLVYYPLPHGGH